ncbi:hypothetical protein AB3G45_17625 [Shinella sp. S4-D37]
MSGFTEEERTAWLERRNRQETELSVPDGGDTTCLHCQRPMFRWQASDPDNPLCETCL